MKPTIARNTVLLALCLVLTALLLASDVEAGKKKKKKKSKKPAPVTAPQQEATSGLPAPSAAAREADRHLVAYDTVSAGAALDAPGAGENGDESDAWIATARGRVLEQNLDYEAAATELRRAADLDPRNPAPTLFLGDTYAYAGERRSADDAWAQAEVRARELLTGNSDDPKALYYLGVAQQRRKRFADAAGTLEKARSLRPGDSAILYQLGATRFYQEQFQAAFDLLSAALDKNSGIAYAYYYRGLAAGKLDRKDILFNDLDRFVKMAPDAPEASTAKQILASFR